MKAKFLLLGLLIAIGLIGLSPAAAQGTTEAPTVTEGDQLLHETFRSSSAWEKYTTDEGVDFSISGGTYGMYIPTEQPNSFIWAVNSTPHTDVIIEATFFQRNDNPEAKYGLMCRADADGFGYYFVIGGDGSAFIGKGVTDTIEHLVDIASSDAILTGTDANLVRAICAGDYLALYVNDELVADARDSEFTEGLAGLTSSTGADQDGDVSVDDLDIYQAVFEESTVPPTEIPTEIATEIPTEIPTEAPTESAVVPIEFTRGRALLREHFNDEDAWENYEQNGAQLGVNVDENTYDIHIPKAESQIYYWGVNNEDYGDAILEAQMALSDDNPSAEYGVMCRVTDDGLGYYFMVTGDGYGYIAKGDADSVSLISDFAISDAINPSPESNQIRAVCVGNYLALFVNDKLVVDVNDDSYTSGAAGLVGLSGDDQDTDVVVNTVDVTEAVISESDGNDNQGNQEAPTLENVEVGKLLLNEPFDSDDSWPASDSNDGKAHLAVDDGAYVATINGEGLFYNGVNATISDNYVISVEATFDDGPENNAFGVMCRAATEDAVIGYFFAVSADGYAAIMRSDANADKLIPLVDWEETSAVNQGKNATNTLTVACVDDYLTLYVNGTKVAETHDSTYTEGVTGLFAGEFETGEAKFSFDNLNLYNAKSA